jgi:hypothetical protein
VPAIMFLFFMMKSVECCKALWFWMRDKVGCFEIFERPLLYTRPYEELVRRKLFGLGMTSLEDAKK